MAKAEAVLNRIIDSQEESGYVGATAKSFRSLERLVRGMDAYELYFVFHAFITVYEETGDKKALTAAEKLADYFLPRQTGVLAFHPKSAREQTKAPGRTIRVCRSQHTLLLGRHFTL